MLLSSFSSLYAILADTGFDRKQLAKSDWYFCASSCWRRLFSMNDQKSYIFWYCSAICGLVVFADLYSLRNFFRADTSKRPVCWFTNGVCMSIGFVPCVSTFCSSLSVTVRPSFPHSLSRTLLLT